MSCLYCHSDEIQKNGTLPGGGQRYKCTDCDKQFSLGGIRGTYPREWKEFVASQYLHKHTSARKLSEDFHLSTATIVSRGKQHKEHCNKCSS